MGSVRAVAATDPAAFANEVSNDAKRIQTLIQKTLASNSAREKNAFLNELKKLFKKHMADYASVVQESEKLDEQIAATKVSFGQLNEQYEALKQSVAFLSKLEFYQAAPDVGSLKQLIRSIERDILAVAPLADKNLLDSTNDYLDLLDIRETRLRQLVEALKLRIKTAEERLECASSVIDEFGSITNLLERVRHLREENERLKVRQLRFSRESLLKPRRLTRCEPSTLRAFLVALQNELAIARREVADAQRASEESLAVLPDESEFALDLLSHGLEFSDELAPLAHAPLDLTPATITSITEGIVGVEPPEIQLVQIDNEYAALKERTQRLRSELTLRRNAERVAQETGKQRVEKLHALNERLLAEIHTLQEQVEAATAARTTLEDMLAEVLRERDDMTEKSQRLAADYHELYGAHLSLREQFKRTWRAGAGLFRLAELFGKAYLAQVLEPGEFTNQVAAFTPLAEPSTRPYFTEQPPAVLIKFFRDMHAELVRRRATRVTEGRKLDELRAALDGRTVDEALRDVADVVERAPQDVLEQLSGQGRVRAVFDELLVGIRAETSRDLDAFGQQLSANFQRLHNAGEAILCKVKRAMATQTFQARKADIETQYVKGEIQKLAKAAAKK